MLFHLQLRFQCAFSLNENRSQRVPVMNHLFFIHLQQRLSAEQRLTVKQLFDIRIVIPRDDALEIEFSYSFNNFVIAWLLHLIDKTDQNLIGSRNLLLKQWFRTILSPSLGRNNSNDRVKLSMYESLLVKPKLLDRLDRVSHSIGLHQYLFDWSIRHNVLNSRHQIIPKSLQFYLALQQMHPFGNSRKSLKGV